MKKLFIFVFTLILIISPVFSVGSSASYNGFVELYGKVFLLVNADNGTVIFSQNSDKKVYPAAVVKMVTAIAVARNCKNFDETVTASYEAVHSLDGLGCITSGIEEGEQMKVRDLLACMMLNSSNDAAVVLAEKFGPGVDGFVAKMNDVAKNAGCRNTLFTDPTGIDSNQYSTASDLALLAGEYLKYPVLTDITKELFYDTSSTNKSSERELLNSNDMINYYREVYYEYVNGLKDGYDSDKGRNVVSTASRDGYTYIAVVLECPDSDSDKDGSIEKTAFYDCKKMFKWAFGNLSMATVADTSTYVSEVEVKLAKSTDYVRLVPANKVSSLVPDGVDGSSVNFVCDVPEYIYAPVKKGDILGKADIMYAEEKIATVDLVAGEDVEVNGFLFFFHLIFLTLKSPVFIAIASVVIISFLIYMYTVAKKSRKKTAKIKKRYENSSEGAFNTERKTVKKKNGNTKSATVSKKTENKKPSFDVETNDGDIDFSLFE